MQRVEHSSRPERAPAALHHDLVPAFGEEQGHPGDAVTPVRGADQHRVPVGSLRMPVVGEECGSVVRRDRDVGRARDLPVRLRGHVDGSGEASVLPAGCAAETGSIGHRTPFTLVTANAAITAITTAPM